MQINKPKNAMKTQNQRLVSMGNLATKKKSSRISGWNVLCKASLKYIFETFMLRTNLIQILLIIKIGLEHVYETGSERKKGFYQKMFS